MIERAVSFGTDNALVGVLTEPAADRAIAQAPTFLLFNTGIHHKVGPYRVNVDLARALARAGFASLRFDVSGLGDSPLGASADEDRQRHDVTAAMTYLEKKRAARTFAVVGFCSGVDAAFPITRADPRVVGCVLIEGYAYATTGNRARRPLRLFDMNRWERRLRFAAARYLPSSKLGLQLQPISSERAPNVFVRNYPERRDFARDVKDIARRGARLLFVYFGGDTDVSHESQLAETLDRVLLPNGVDVAFFPDMDHIMYRPSDRAEVVAAIVRFAERELRHRSAPLLGASI